MMAALAAAAMANNQASTQSIYPPSSDAKLISPNSSKSLVGTNSNCVKQSGNTAYNPTNPVALASSIVAAAAHASSLQQQSNPTMKNSIKLCRRRKARTVFSDQQLSGLEKRFETQKYLSTPERVELANSLGLSETQVSFV